MRKSSTRVLLQPAVLASGNQESWRQRMGTRAQALDTFLQRQCAKNMVFGGEVCRWEACWDDDHHCFSRRCMIDKWFGFSIELVWWFGWWEDVRYGFTMSDENTWPQHHKRWLLAKHSLHFASQYLSWTVEVTWSLAFVSMSNVNSGLVEACAVIIWGGVPCYCNTDWHHFSMASIPLNLITVYESIV